jgi:hypothetical protein
LAKLGGVISHSYNGIGTDLDGVLDHSIKGLAAGLFADDGKFLDIAAGYRLDAADKPAADARSPNDDASNDAQVFADLFAVNSKTCCYDHVFVRTTCGSGWFKWNFE